MTRTTPRPEDTRNATKRRAVFLDRDGTVNRDVGYPCRFEQVHIYPTSYEAVRIINALGLSAVIITHQSGVARGYISEDEVLRLHGDIERAFRGKGARLDGIFHCPHDGPASPCAGLPECECAKPRPGLAFRAAETLGLDLGGCYMVGDKVADILFARNIGAVPILVLTGYGRESLPQLENRGIRPAHVAGGLLEAVTWIRDEERKR